MVSVLVVGCGTSQGPAADSNSKTYAFKFAHEEISGSVQDEYIQQFKKILEQRSNGRIKVKVYPA